VHPLFHLSYWPLVWPTSPPFLCYSHRPASNREQRQHAPALSSQEKKIKRRDNTPCSMHRPAASCSYARGGGDHLGASHPQPRTIPSPPFFSPTAPPQNFNASREAGTGFSPAPWTGAIRALDELGRGHGLDVTTL
jgi:hypothetical protein